MDGYELLDFIGCLFLWLFDLGRYHYEELENVFDLDMRR